MQLSLSTMTGSFAMRSSINGTLRLEISLHGNLRAGISLHPRVVCPYYNSEVVNIFNYAGVLLYDNIKYATPSLVAKIYYVTFRVPNMIVKHYNF